MVSSEQDILTEIKDEKELFWLNDELLPIQEANKKTSYSFEDVQDAEARLQRFSSFIRKAYPETEEDGGIIESSITEIPNMKSLLDEKYNQSLEGSFYLKRDDQLPISGTVKARGAIYEVLKHAESLALENGLLSSTKEDYSVFATKKFQDFFSEYNITVGTTGNLGISVGRMGRMLGFDVTVHMSVEAKEWKKQYLRDLGVNVIEHETNFSLAVNKGRALSEADPKSYFVDDENSESLFFGYTAGGYRMKEQLKREGIKVDEEHPLFVYLPCGIGGAPTGVTFGLKQAFGDNVHCIFAEPTKMPSMLIGLESQLFNDVSVEDVGLGGSTVADGLAVPRTSALVSKLARYYFSAGYTLQDGSFQRLLWNLYHTESIFLEPAAVAGVVGPYALMSTQEGQAYMKNHELQDKLANATHIAWATGGSMVPNDYREEFIEEGKQAEKHTTSSIK
ncbi:D-serine ammonia-lyase [Tetragenococcus muriaticus]|uniref:Probable D-serine dehydratase n=2 Tax=Tetragenococcus muriaticus TaxID=64642 RepID=A0A091C5K1_9ENTE|nr:D-serine ammonia-lyase [Tetragenococcus muriaticus]KFN93136.1 D-serine dehydratase [Tetragenococcus muriaticus 3MR10-3]GMA47502.1 putative D-serine dehydratase [Tetragenococcus muriaticus]